MNNKDLHQLDSVTSELEVIVGKIDRLKTAVAWQHDDLFENERPFKEDIEKYQWGYEERKINSEMHIELMDKYFTELKEVSESLQELFRNEWNNKKADNPDTLASDGLPTSNKQ
ncbi:hypothetical protein ERX35_000935 [Macrococcus equipercicus]|uniref:TscT toxin domain-containing protein n=1 Tax=Macrococcus equipercicus TaxID=69967 RepID=A0ABQ6RB59_9STAP|nr:DUF1474 family protein [Macrococcus equipercicus]KAA1042477.1 hypothetical protein ERX35_000935 [Macrococcus equipercicus]